MKVHPGDNITVEITDEVSSKLADQLCKLTNTVDTLASLILTKLTNMANKLDDYIASQKEANDKINAAVTGISGDVAGLKKRIDDLLAAQGETITNDQKALLQELSQSAGAIVSKCEALDASTPAEG